MLNSLSGLFTKKTRPANQARLDELEREIDSLKATIARIETPPNSFSKNNAFANEVDNQESFARKFRRAGVATASSIQFGEVLPALKTKKALMSSSAQVSLRQAVLASPLFAGVQKSVEAIIHRFKPYDYESGETVTREDSPPCYVIVENGLSSMWASRIEPTPRGTRSASSRSSFSPVLAARLSALRQGGAG